MNSKVILAVDRNQRNVELLSQFLTTAGYRAATAATLEDLDSILERPEDISLALIDVAGFDRSVWERCQRLGERGVPLLVISPRSPQAQREGLGHGARGVLTKPLVMRELLVLIRGLVED